MRRITGSAITENVILKEFCNIQIICRRLCLPLFLHCEHWLRRVHENIQRLRRIIRNELHFGKGEHADEEDDWEHNFDDECVSVANLRLDLLCRQVLQLIEERAAVWVLSNTVIFQILVLWRYIQQLLTLCLQIHATFFTCFLYLFTMTDFQEHFFKGCDADTVRPELESIQVLIKVCEELLEETWRLLR